MPYELRVSTSFFARHALSLKGEQEPLHEHTWEVVTSVRGMTLDQDGLLCDFHVLEEMLTRIVSPFADGNLNCIPPFDARNPSAELVAQYIADRMADGLPAGLTLESVTVTEAPGCAAKYRPHT